MATEKTIRLASEFYEMRDAARMLFGADYPRRMAEARVVIETVQSKLKLGPIEAAMKICQNVEGGGFKVIYFMAAVVEMLEPLNPSQESPK